VIDEFLRVTNRTGGADADAGAPPAGTAGERTVAAPTPPTSREQQRARTRQAILEATVAALVEDGYAALTTRRIAERAGIAQSTLMHHFETRELLIVEAVAGLAEQLAVAAVQQLDLTGLRGAAHREAVLDLSWALFTTPEALAAAQLWGAAWTEPEIASALRDLELRVAELILTTATTVFPEETQDPRFPVFIDGVYQMIRGLVIGIPTWGADAINARWALIKPVLLEASLEVIPPQG
jgi:AcrR family transcriptional regulator